MTSNITIGLSGGVRMHFPHLDEPWSGPTGEQEPKYSALLLLDKKTAAADIDAVRKAIGATLAAKGWSGANRPQQLRVSFNDGDEKIKDPITGQEEFKKQGDEFRGQFYLSARSGTKPGVIVGAKKRPATPADLVAGHFVAASVDAFAFVKSGAGVGFGLQNVWILKRGEPLMAGGAHRDVDSDFGADTTSKVAEDFDDTIGDVSAANGDAAAKFF